MFFIKIERNRDPMTLNNKYEYLDASLVSNLSFAVLAVDDFTGEQPLGGVRVSTKDPDHQGILNNSGYYLFLDLDNTAKYKVKISTESGLYAASETIVDLATLRRDPNFQINPVIVIKLLPNASYPFPLRASLIRGTVQTLVGSERVPLAGAQVKIVERDLTYLTSERGEYIFYFTNLRTDEIIEEGTKRFIRMGSSSQFTLRVDHPGYSTYEQNSFKAEEGKTTVVDVAMAAG
jgi:hypothetical protein